MSKEEFSNPFHQYCAQMAMEAGLLIYRQCWDKDYGICILLWQDPILMMHMGSEL